MIVRNSDETHENGEYPTDELKDAYNKYSKYHNENKHKMQSIFM